MGKHHFRPLLGELERLQPGCDAADLIRRGAVRVDGRIVTNPRSLVRGGAAIVVHGPSELRGEVKLRAALQTFGVDVAGRIALDAGAAAGGFTSALLRAGSERVYAVDAGFGQLRGSLRRDPRVVNLERVNVGELTTVHVPDVVDVVTFDLSYLALARAVRELERLRLAADAELLALVKPMFELQLATPPRDAVRLRRAVARAAAGMTARGWSVVGDMRSPVEGARGAIEFFVYGVRARRGRKSRHTIGTRP
jgi:23S rRNA (cytidine1920-2'-O)/16S rRNA (cytidine1409-2'-O)-methyltransferase